MPIHHRLTICNLMGVAQAGLFRRQQYDLRATDRGFGFVSTSVSAGGVLAPVLFGWIIDQGHPGWVFGLLGILTMVSLVTVLVPERSRTV